MSAPFAKNVDVVLPPVLPPEPVVSIGGGIIVLPDDVDFLHETTIRANKR